MSRVAKVVLNKSSKYVDREFSYLANDDVERGMYVLVPFGRGNRLYDGLVTEVEEIENYEESDLKKVIRILDKDRISGNKITLGKWIRQEYMSSLAEAFGLFLNNSEDVQIVYENFLVPTSEKYHIISAKENVRKSSRNRIMLLELLTEGEINISSLSKELGKSLLETAKKIENLGIARLEKRRLNRIPKTEYVVKNSDINLSDDQKRVSENIFNNIKSKIPTLLFGITGSGKTEVYIDLIKKTIVEKKQVIVLVPEISLTPQTISRFKNIFGDRVGVFHSKISQGERKDQFHLIKQGKIDIVIGARSALFVPFENLGLVVIDECHDDAYKSEHSPKYDAIEVAQKLCELYGAGVVLGTATPTVEQYYKATKNEYRLEILDKRQKGIIPSIKIIDTYDEFGGNKSQIFSSVTIQRIRSELERGRQVIVFLNKRGYATTLSCDICNHTVMCPSCDISLTYHRDGNRLLCHYCGHSEHFEKKCKNCESGHYVYIGYGTQKVEDELLKKIDIARTVRLDRDTTQKKGGHEKLLEEFKDKRANVLIGTQMISKGLDFEKVSLVVVLNADSGLRFPDYRSVEKTFNLLLQVSGRAGRGDVGGEVIIQTSDRKNNVFRHIESQDYKSFFEDEIKERETFLYPPFSHLIKIQCTAEKNESVAETTQKIKNAIEFYLKKKDKNLVAYGPVPNLIQRIENKYRWQLFYKILKYEDLDLMKNIISFILSEKRSIIVNSDVSVSVEMNPKNMI